MTLGNMTDKEILDTAHGMFSYSAKDEMSFSITNLLKFARYIERDAQETLGVIRYYEGKNDERQRTLDALKTAIEKHYWSGDGAPQVIRAISDAKHFNQKRYVVAKAEGVSDD